MSQLHKVAPDLFQVTLSAPTSLGHTWGNARNVYVFTGEAPALIDSGYAQSADELHQALQILNIAPADIRRIVLTSRTADAAGPASTFPNARLWTALQPEDPVHAHARARYQKSYQALLSLPGIPTTGTQDPADQLLGTVFCPPPPSVQ